MSYPQPKRPSYQQLMAEHATNRYIVEHKGLKGQPYNIGRNAAKRAAKVK